jgi:hypothetical protein
MTETHSEKDDGREEGEEAPQRGEDAHNEVGAQGEEEGDKGEAGRDGREDESLGEGVPDRAGGGVGAGQLRQSLLVAVEVVVSTALSV